MGDLIQVRDGDETSEELVEELAESSRNAEGVDIGSYVRQRDLKIGHPNFIDNVLVPLFYLIFRRRRGHL